MLLPVAVGQIPISWSIPENIEVIAAAIECVESGTLLVLPEAAISGYDDTLSGLDYLDPAELLEAQAAVANAATAHGVHVVCGSLLYEAGSWWNAAIYFAPGQERWVYRKVNLAMHERGRLLAGSQLPTVEMQLPSGAVRAGMQLCREIRFAEQWHCLARDGAQILLYLTYAANPAEPTGVWRSHLISRAAETQSYVIAANVANPSQHCPTMIVSPRGEVVEEAGPEATLLQHHVDLAVVRDGYLNQQRRDVVSIEYGAAQ